MAFAGERIPSTNRGKKLKMLRFFGREGKKGIC